MANRRTHRPKKHPLRGNMLEMRDDGGLGRSWGPLRMGGGERWPPDTHSAGGGRLVQIYPVCTDFCPTFLATLQKKKTSKNLATLSDIGDRVYPAKHFCHLLDYSVNNLC